MSYRMPASASLDHLIDHAVGVIAAVQATDEFSGNAQMWLDLRAKLLAARDHRDGLRWALAGAQRKVDYRDVRWDAAILDLSGRAFLAAGKDAAASPYADLFGAISGAGLRNLGPVRATAAAQVILTKGAALDHPDLKDSLATLAAATHALQAADEERTLQRNQVLALDIARAQLVDAVEHATAATEVAILTQAPGRRDLVRALLAPARPERTAPEPEVG